MSAVFLTLVGSLLWARWRPADHFVRPDVESDAFRIVTWNVGYFALTSNKNMKDVDVELVSSLLKEVDAEMVILQELGTLDQAEQIADHLGESWTAYSTYTGHGEQVVSVISSLEVVHEEDVLCGGRHAKGVTVLDHAGNEVYVLGVHAPHPARGFAENVDSIEDALDHARTRTESFRLVAGDLNYNFDDGAMGDLYASIREDFGDGTLHLGETYYAHTRIDHVFHYPDHVDVVKEESGMLPLAFRFAAVPGFRDHRPIVVSYDLSEG